MESLSGRHFHASSVTSLGIVHLLQRFIGFCFVGEAYKAKATASVRVTVLDDYLNAISNQLQDHLAVNLQLLRPCRIVENLRRVSRQLCARRGHCGEKVLINDRLATVFVTSRLPTL